MIKHYINSPSLLYFYFTIICLLFKFLHRDDVTQLSAIFQLLFVLFICRFLRMKRGFLWRYIWGRSQAGPKLIQPDVSATSHCSPVTIQMGLFSLHPYLGKTTFHIHRVQRGHICFSSIYSPVIDQSVSCFRKDVGSIC